LVALQQANIFQKYLYLILSKYGLSKKTQYL